MNIFCRLSRAFVEQINAVIGSFADIQFALFPLQCFPLSNSRQLSVTFSSNAERLSQGNSHSVNILLCVEMCNK